MGNTGDPWKIASCINGALKLHEENVQKLVNYSLPLKNYSTAFLTVMGPPSSGPSFYTNLLLNHLQDDGYGSLMSFCNSRDSNKEESRYLPGFSYNNISSTVTFKAPEAEPSGIYAWQTPICIKNYHGNILFWVLHMHQNKSCEENPTEQRILALFLHLLCTRTIIIASDLEQVQGYHFHNEWKEEESTQFQKSVLYIFRTSSEPFRWYSYDKISGKNLEDEKYVPEFADFLKTVSLENYKSVGAVYLPDYNDNLHDSEGHLTLDEASFSQLDRVMKLMGDINQIRPQMFKKRPLEPSTVFQFLADCIEILNRNGWVNNGKDAKKSLKSRKSLPGNFVRDKYKQMKSKKSLQENSFSQHDADESKHLSVIIEKAHADLQLFIQLKFFTYFMKFVGTDSVSFIDTLLGDSINDVMQNLGSYQQLSRHDSNKLQENLKLQSKALKLSYIETHNILTSFYAKIENFFRDLLHSPEEILDHKQFTRMETQICKQMKRIQSNELAVEASNQLQATFLEHLKRFRENEESLINTAIELLVNEYKEYMDNLVSKHPTGPKTLKKLHLELSQNFLSAFCIAVYPHANYSNKNRIPVLFDVEKRISSIYRAYKDANTVKLKSMHETVSQLIVEEKKHYCEKMEKILQQNAEGPYLQKMHETYWAESISNLESNVVSRIGNKEPRTVYVATLNAHINKYWRNFQRKKDPKRVKKEKSTKQLQQQNTAEFSRATAPTILLQTPIIFQFSLTEVAAAVEIENVVKILHKEELHFAITPSGSWLCGNAVKSDSLYQKHLQIANIWDRKKLNATGKIVNEKNLSTESMLGFLLSTLKQKVEMELNGIITNCLIVIPFWFTSFRRQQVVDSGKIAGFERVLLINENTAIGIYAAEQEKIQNRCSEVFVLSENSHYVDATIYSIDKNSSSIKMISHCGNYNIATGTSNSLIEACVNAEIESKPVTRSSWGKFAGKNRSKISNKVLYISYQHANWERTLCEVKAQLRSVIDEGEKGNWESKFALIGALYFYQESLHHRVVISQEWICYTTFLSIKSKNIPLFSKGGSYVLPILEGTRRLVSQLPARIIEVEIYQKLDKFKDQTQIGVFRFNSKLKQPCPCLIEIDYQGMITILTTQQDKFTFIPCNLTNSQITSAKNNVEAFAKQALEENEYINELAEKLKHFQALIGKGKVQFLSKAAQDEVLNQITKNIQILSSPATPDTVKNISLTYETLQRKYIKPAQYI